MTRGRTAPLTALLVGILLTAGGCVEEKLPSRDQIPVLKDKLYRLELAVGAHNRAAIDSLLSVDILEAGQDSDSLLRFVYGPDGTRPFHRLGDYEIFYSNDVAIITCFIMDSTEQRERPLRLQYGNQEGLWLLKEFRVGDPDSASEI